MSLSDRVQELNREISATVERALSDVRREISERLRTSSDEVLRRLDEISPALPGSFLAHEDLAPAADEMCAEARRGAFGELRGALAALDRARSQSEILAALLAESSRYASRTALLLTRAGEIRGWAGRGFGDADASIVGLILPAADGAWGRLAEGKSVVRLTAADCAELSSRLESPLAREGVLVPLILRDRVAAALYADRVESDELTIEALQILAYAASQAIESLPFRERAATPTLILDEGEAPAEAAALGLWPTSGSAAAAAVAPVEPAPAPVQAPPAAPAMEPTPEPEPEPAPQAWEAPQPWEAPRGDVELDVAPAEELPAPWTAPVPVEAPTAPEPPPAPAPWSFPPPASAAPAAPAAMTEELPALRDLPSAPTAEATAPVRLPSPDATVLLQRSTLTAVPEPPPAAPAPPPLRSVAPPAPEPEPAADPLRAPGAGAAAEVRPPSGVDGPGWAFATTRVPVSPSDEALHEEARRLARLLVSEIKLYNEDQVEEGRRNRDIYERLKEDIDRSRQMYEERVDPRILRSTDYFYQELVRILASGDSKSLGI
jgi:hypothetical protein